MEIEVQISFDVNAIFVQAGGLNKKFANLMAYEKGFNKIIAIGETEQELAAQNPQHWERIKGAVAFKPIFDPRSFDPEGMYWATRMLASRVHDELRGVNLLDKLNCDVNIPKYEMVALASIEHFEMRLERWPKLRKLSVNGTVVILKSLKYQLVKFALNWGGRILCFIFLIIFASRRDIFIAILAPMLAKASIWVTPIFAFLFIGMWWTAEIIWLVASQWLLPKQTLRRIFDLYQLQFAAENKATVSKLLAEWILGKND